MLACKCIWTYLRAGINWSIVCVFNASNHLYISVTQIIIWSVFKFKLGSLLFGSNTFLDLNAFSQKLVIWVQKSQVEKWSRVACNSISGPNCMHDANINGSYFHDFTIPIITPNIHLYLHATQNRGKWENMDKWVHMSDISLFRWQNLLKFQKEQKTGVKI